MFGLGGFEKSRRIYAPSTAKVDEIRWRFEVVEPGDLSGIVLVCVFSKLLQYSCEKEREQAGLASMMVARTKRRARKMTAISPNGSTGST